MKRKKELASKFLAIALAISLLAAVLIGANGPYPPAWSTDLLACLAAVWPKLSLLPALSHFPSVTAATVVVQWCFYPLYFLLLLLIQQPWSTIHKTQIEKNGASATVGQKILCVCMHLCLLAYVSGTFGFSAFPTFINGGMLTVDPEIMPGMLKSFHRSRFGLVIWAWLSPFLEATMGFLAVYFTLHMRRFLMASRSAQLVVQPEAPEKPGHSG